MKEEDFQKLIGRQPTPDVKVFSADVVANILDKLELQGIRKANEEVISKAERNKAFRDGSYGALRCVAIDGWEPFSSYDRHYPHCLARKVKRPGGALEEVEQYYHRYVVALLLGPVLDVVLEIEPVLNEEALRDDDPEHEGHEGELTAGKRLIDSLHKTCGGFLDAFVLDALYANGPLMTQLNNYGYGGFLVLKKENNEPLKEALTLWQMQGRCQTYDDADRKEHVEFWDVDDIETLDSYKGKVRAIRAVVTEQGEDPSTWCFAIVGHRAQLSRRTALQIIRSRWHIENTAFHQWVRYWNLFHVFRHTQNALMSVLTSLDTRFQSASAVHLSQIRSSPKAQGPYGYHPTSRQGHASRSGPSSRADSLVDFPARYQLRRRRTHANWGGQTHRPLTSPPPAVTE